MSIKSIDAQMMIARLPDNVNQASSLVKRPEIVQEFLAHQGKINDVHDQSRVAKTLESEMEQIRTDVDEDSQGGYGGGGDNGSRSGRGGNEEVDQDMLVPPVNHVIDITI